MIITRQIIGKHKEIIIVIVIIIKEKFFFLNVVASRC